MEVRTTIKPKEMIKIGIIRYFVDVFAFRFKIIVIKDPCGSILH